MKRKLLFAAALVAGALGFNANAQDVTDLYLTNPGFENGTEGWTTPTRNASTIDTGVKTSSDACYEFGQTVPSEGEKYLNTRSGWNNTNGSISWDLSTKTNSLPAGKYYVQCEYKAADACSQTWAHSNINLNVYNSENTQIGFSNYHLSRWFSDGDEGFNTAPVWNGDEGKNYFTNADWTPLGTYFQLDTDGEVTITAKAVLWSNRRSDFCYDNFKLYDVNAATEENPIDMTGLIPNNKMESGLLSWSEGMGTHSPNRTGFSGALQFEKFVEKGKTLGDFDVYQTINNIPNGKYRFSAYVVAVQQGGVDDEAMKNVDGVSLYAGEKETAVATADTPEEFSVEIVVTDGKLKLGLKTESCTANWVAWDNLKLEYLGADYATVIVTEAGYATYVAPTALAFDEDEAFVVADVDGATATLESVEAVPAGTPVIIKGAGTHTFSPVATADKPASNLLEVSDDNVTAAEGIYVLANLEEGVGFYELGEDYALAAGRVYLNAAGAEVKFIGFNFGGDATAIKGVESAASAENAVIYNLAGQRVQNPGAGIYIVNGKKVLVK